MEAAALYAFAEARSKPVPCFAHATIRQVNPGTSRRGANGATAPLALIHAVVEAYLDTWSRQDEGAGPL
jgi:uridine phosphorylase